MTPTQIAKALASLNRTLHELDEAVDMGGGLWILKMLNGDELEVHPFGDVQASISALVGAAAGGLGGGDAPA